MRLTTLILMATIGLLAMICPTAHCDETENTSAPLAKSGPAVASVDHSATSAVNVLSFCGHVIQPGTDQEDWQPAFQQAVEVAQRECRPIHVPAGVYKIRKAITITPKEETPGGFGSRSLRIVGEGRHQTCICQEVDTENVIDWTGLEYEKRCTNGELLSIGLRGGQIGLNLKWHTYFSLDSCYIHGAKKYGIYTEVWSSRFRNSIIRWCGEAGIRGTAHFNNNIVRDCYFSRNGIGFFFTGGYGNRIEGSAFEGCPKAAIFLRGTNSFTVNNCYFEGNGFKGKTKHFLPVEGSADTIHLDYACADFSIHDNIFRCNQDQDGALLSVAYAITGRVYDNRFIHADKAMELRDKCETNENAKAHFGRTIVENNSFDEIEQVLSEAQPGLIERAISQGSEFRLRRKPVCEGSPIGKVRPEYIGDEILDLKAKKWYKSVGPKLMDWVERI